MAVALGAKIYLRGLEQNINAKEDSNSILTFNLLNADYFHLLSCEVVWKSTDSNNNIKYKTYPAKHLTVDMRTNIKTNAYLKPSFRQPYYLLSDNVNNTGREKQSDDLVQFQNLPVIDVHLGKLLPGVELERVERKSVV